MKKDILNSEGIKVLRSEATRILISLSIVGVLSTLVIGGTRAVFFDREIATENIFRAGFIDLQLRDEFPANFQNGAIFSGRVEGSYCWWH